METLESKLDLTKADPLYYKAKATPALVHLGAYYYLTISGQSAPEDPRFIQAIEAIYAVAYGIKFLNKAEDNDFVVPKMECNWWIAGGLEQQHLFAQAPRSKWHWKVSIRMPDMVASDHFFRAVHLAKTKKAHMKALEDVKFESSQEGLCVQILHRGSWEDEEPSIRQLLDFVKANRMEITSYHKEIYLTDPKRVAPEKLKTILRYRVKNTGLN
ncbi:MAG: GyrI-like domain-containing protein [Marinoscillum sp.]|uniref:GyrI-like domain-containing protein n=1 Tax=Marinoscillum sp. TaxID=2024838 RepID=UPI0032F2A7FD